MRRPEVVSVCIAHQNKKNKNKRLSCFLVVDDGSFDRRSCAVSFDQPAVILCYQGKSLSATFVQVRYPIPPTGPLPPVRSSSRLLPMIGRTTSLASALSSSIRFSKRRRLSRLYISGVNLRKRLHSSWPKNPCPVGFPSVRYVLPSVDSGGMVGTFDTTAALPTGTSAVASDELARWRPEVRGGTGTAGGGVVLSASHWRNRLTASQSR